MSIRVRYFVPKLYYTITPLFILLDYVWGINVRTAVLDSEPLYKGLYYGFCVLCGVVIYIIPRLSPVVALVESIIMIMMTVLSVFTPYLYSIVYIDDILNVDIQYVSILGPSYIVNLVLSGGMAAFTFHKSLNVLGISGN
jgi:hypothetical protein